MFLLDSYVSLQWVYFSFQYLPHDLQEAIKRDEDDHRRKPFLLLLSLYPYMRYTYAQTSIVVVLVLVKLFGFGVITMRRYCSRMKATSLPDLPKPTRTLNSIVRPEFLNTTSLYKTENNFTTISF